jgi:phospholipase C
MQTRAINALIVSLQLLSLLIATGCGGGAGSQSGLTLAPAGGVGPVFSFTPNPNPGPPKGITSNDPGQINHIIFMLQENRSFDMYFGKMNEYRASRGLPQDVDGLPANASNPSVDGTSIVQPFHLQTMCTEDLSPFWNESHVAFNRTDPSSSTPMMDGFVTAAGHYAVDQNQHDTQGLRAMGYYDAGDIPFYYFMAAQFAISDRWFSPVNTNTDSNRHYVYAATSTGHVYPWHDSPDTHKTIVDLLEAKGISWRIYAERAANSVFFEFQSSRQLNDHVVALDQLFTDMAAGTLPSVAMIETAQSSEHPQDNVQTGAALAARVVNALIASPNWKDSALFLSYDEGGGLYDHVPPLNTVAPDDVPIGDLKPNDICFSGCTGSAAGFTRTGFRVPFTVISPFAKPHYVSHTPADHTAVLKFIEDRYGLPRLTARDAAQPGLNEFFDFSAPNLHPPSPPGQPTNGPCYHDRLP